MITKLKRRFIILAMAALAILLAVIVAGMNIINYRKVVNDADTRIEVLEENSGRLLGGRGGNMHQPFMEGFGNAADNDAYSYDMDDSEFGDIYDIPSDEHSDGSV